MIARYAAATMLAILLTACAEVKISPENARQLNGKKLVPENHTAMYGLQFSDFASGLVPIGGLSLTIAHGNAIARKYQIEDPVFKVSKGLADKLQAIHGMAVLPPSSTGTTTEPQADYRLIVASSVWNIEYIKDLKIPAHYKMHYYAAFDLETISTKELVARARCETQQGDDTEEHLLENQAALLKQIVDQTAASCVDKLFSESMLWTDKQSAANNKISSK